MTDVRATLTGLVFDIKRFALHDGPGIRTTAFLKGCPLTCPWCQNPEGMTSRRQVWYDRAACIRCERCVAACPLGAVKSHPDTDTFITIDRAVCDRNGACVEACPTGAIHWDSREWTVTELVDELERDRVFYETSGGGVTLSGGEPLFQPDFAHAVLTESKRRDLHTALETTLSVNQHALERFLPVVDFFMSDLKLWDDAAHRRTVGVPVGPVKRNIAFLAESGVDLLIRVPLIPEITATNDSIAPIARFVAELPGDVPLELINFNPLPAAKYRALGREYAFSAYTAPYSQEEYDEFVAVARAEGARVIRA